MQLINEKELQNKVSVEINPDKYIGTGCTGCRVFSGI
jgi:hypothetical protein